jgi:uncharacterized membrane protein YcaP (DUF421 family)
MTTLWGNGAQLDALQMSVRAFVMFFIVLALIRLGGARMFGRKSSFDNVVAIVLGAVAARGIAGASSFGATVAACAVIVALHRVIAWLVVRHPGLGRLLQGRPVTLYSHGRVHRDRLAEATISEQDLLESLRLETRSDALDGVEEARMETNGRVSFIAKPR